MRAVLAVVLLAAWLPAQGPTSKATSQPAAKPALSAAQKKRRVEAAKLVELLELPKKRDEAVRALLALRGDAVPALVVALSDSRKELRKGAIIALCGLGQAAKPAIPLLQKQWKAGSQLAGDALRSARFGGTTVVADYSDNRVLILNAKGEVTRTVEKTFGVWDAELLPDGKLLVTEFAVNRVSILDGKKVVWSYDKLTNPYDADLLPNGNVLIADTYGRRVIEVTPKKKIAWTYDKIVQPYDVDRLPNGNTLIVDGSEDRIIEVDKKGKIVWKLKNIVNCHDADRLPNGNMLITIRMSNLVQEVDPTGKVVLKITGLSSPSDADRLPNGNTLVAENGKIREFDRKGKEVWIFKTTWAVEVSRY